LLTTGTHGSGRSEISLTLLESVRTSAIVDCPPSRKAVLSWNTHSPRGELSFRVLSNGRPVSDWLLHSTWSPGERRSFSPQDDGVRVQTDVITAERPFNAVCVHAHDVYFDALAVATPPHRAAPPKPARATMELAVPARSQYVVEGEREWCSAASLSMLHSYYGKTAEVGEVAREVLDYAYNSTGNWSFNVAYSGRIGLRGLVVYLRDLSHAADLIDAGIPLALSYGWNADELPGAPLEHSQGHLAVLRGFNSSGDPLLNDPASPTLQSVYERNAFERVWLRSGAVAYVVTPPSTEILSFING